jgi:protein-disulfide isomerase
MKKKNKFTRRRSLGLIAGFGLTSVAGCLDSGTISEDYEVPDNAVTSVQIPESDSTYPMMGSDDAELEIQYFGNWKCPACAAFSKQSLLDIVSDYVEPGDVRIKFRGLAYIGGQPFLGNDSPRATRAGLSLWQEEPENFWQYYETVMYNQPPESRQWATKAKLKSFMNAVSVTDADAVVANLNSDGLEELVSQTTQDARNLGIDYTPGVEVNGRTFSRDNVQGLRSAIERNLS